VKMSPHAAQNWRAVSRLLIGLGFVGCIATALGLTLLISHYSASRPPVPDPERGWTVGISWTHPTRYGTVQDEHQVLRLFFWGFPSFVLVALGAGVKIYILDDYSVIASRKRPPWNHR